MGTKAPAEHAEGTGSRKPILNLGCVNTLSSLIKTSPRLDSPAPSPSDSASCTTTTSSRGDPVPAAAQFQQLQAQAAQLALRPQQPSNSGASSLRYASDYSIESAASAEDSQPWDLQGGRSTDADQLQLTGRCLGEVRCLLWALLTCT